jgi:hypothetical protein
MGTTITCGGGGVCSLVIVPYVATADDYAAVTLIWAAVMTAAAIIWGAKRLYVLLTSRQE